MKKSVVRLWRLFVGGVFVFFLLIILAMLGVFGKMPTTEELENPSNNLTTQVFLGEDSLYTEFFLENRRYCDFDSISPNVISALVSTEDERFYDHSGIDFEALGRSIVGVITFNRKGGGSTISQQLAKNLFPRENVTMWKLPFIKLKEWIMAVRLERNFTKNEILALYLNKVEFSDHTFGIYNAAMHFFDTEPKNLSVEQAATLVGMLKATSMYNPRRNPEHSTTRRNTVLYKMYDNKRLSRSDYERYSSIPMKLDLQKKKSQIFTFAPYYRAALETELKEFLSQHKKRNGEPYNLYTDGLKIYCTLDPDLQTKAERIVEDHVKRMNRIIYHQPNVRYGHIWKKYEKHFLLSLRRTEHFKRLEESGMADSNIMKVMNTPRKMKIFAWNSAHEKDTTLSPIDSLKFMKTILQAGFAAMDPISGEVKAYVGGTDFKYFRFDHNAYYARRQVGSVIKPLLYCQAITQGKTPCDVIPSRRVFFPEHGYYRGDHSRTGPMQMKDGLAYSKNPIAVNILKIVGYEKSFISFLRKCGVTSELRPYPSIALGAAQISMMEMLRAYTMFPNQGINTKPMFFTRIEDRNGNVLFDLEPEIREVITEEEAYIMTQMMSGTVDYGTGKNMRYKYGVKSDMGGKTGTTNDNADAWFIGYTPQLLGGVWVGFNDHWMRFTNGRIGQGAYMAMPIWGRFFREVLYDEKSEYDPRAEFIPPVSMEGKSICGLGKVNAPRDYNAVPERQKRRRPKPKKKKAMTQLQEEINDAQEAVDNNNEYQ